MHQADIWLRLTRSAGFLTIAAVAIEGVASLLGYVPDIGHAAQLTVMIGAIGAGVCYAMYRLVGLWSH